MNEKVANEITHDWRLVNFGLVKEFTLSGKFNFFSIEKNAFNNFPNLEKVCLNYLGIAKIEQNAFQHLTKLRELSLGANRINDKDSMNEFKGLENLEELHFDQNTLTKIKSNAFQHLSKLKKLILG
jgi:Leucine-rich repeat (LRR) protein